MGGTGNVVKALEQLMIEENIKIIKSAEVTEILSDTSKVKGVKINNSEMIECDYIVCNSDPPNVYKNLIKSNNYNFFFFKQKMKRMDYSMGLFVYYFGSKKQYKDVAHHTIFFGNTYEKHLEKFLKKKYYQRILATICIDLQLQIQIWHLMDRTHFMSWFLCPITFQI